MAKNSNKIWLLFSYDEISNTYAPMRICHDLNGLLDDIRKSWNKPPYLMHYRIVSFDIRDSWSVLYDAGKILVQ